MKKRVSQPIRQRYRYWKDPFLSARKEEMESKSIGNNPRDKQSISIKSKREQMPPPRALLNWERAPDDELDNG